MTAANSRRTFTSITLFVAGLFLVLPCRTQADPVLSDEFNDSAINTSLWRSFQQGFGPSVAEANERLEITLPANSADESPAAPTFSAGYASVCRLRGNFDVQVDYALPTWPSRNGVRIGLQGVEIGGPSRISGGINDPVFGEVYLTNFLHWGCCGIIGTTHVAGKLRLVRSGITVSGHFFNSLTNSWTQIGPSRSATAGDIELSIAAWSHDRHFANQEVKVAFDNFVINQGELSCLANAGPDQTVNEGALVTLDGSKTGGTNVTFDWQQLAGPLVTLNAPTSATPTFTAPTLPGGFGSQVLTFQLTAVSGGQSNTDTVDITVSNVNRAPEAHADAPQTVKELSTVTLNGAASFDPDGDPITYDWVQIDGSPVTLQQGNSANATFQAPQLDGGVNGEEVLTFRLTVSDGACATCLSSSDTVTVTVQQLNHAPEANAGLDQTVNEGSNVTLNATASSDPDGDPIRYTWSQVSGPTVNLPDPTAAMPSFQAPVTGPGGAILVFRLAVGDGQLGGTDEVTITVVNANDPPRCDLAAASPALLWPPNHKLLRVGIVGITDANSSDAVSISVTGVMQDEPVNGLAEGDTSPDAMLQGDHVLLRAERAGTEDGRVYHVHFTATDTQVTGGSCIGMVTVRVPHSMKAGAISVDGGELYDSTRP